MQPVGHDLLYERMLLILRSMVDAPLQHAAPVPVRRDIHALLHRRIKNELAVGGLQLLQAETECNGWKEKI